MFEIWHTYHETGTAYTSHKVTEYRTRTEADAFLNDYRSGLAEWSAHTVTRSADAVTVTYARPAGLMAQPTTVHHLILRIVETCREGAPRREQRIADQTAQRLARAHAIHTIERPAPHDHRAEGNKVPDDQLEFCLG